MDQNLGFDQNALAASRHSPLTGGESARWHRPHTLPSFPRRGARKGRGGCPRTAALPTCATSRYDPSHGKSEQLQYATSRASRRGFARMDAGQWQNHRGNRRAARCVHFPTEPRACRQSTAVRHARAAARTHRLEHGRSMDPDAGRLGIGRGPPRRGCGLSGVNAGRSRGVEHSPKSSCRTESTRPNHSMPKIRRTLP